MSVSFLQDRCTACGACAVACMDLNDIDTEGGQRPYRRVYTTERDGRTEHFSAACLHCEEAPCVSACPMGCLFRDEEAGLTRYDNTDCIGCRLCESACPHDALTFRPDPDSPGGVRMEKCHGCMGFLAEGLLPPCVRACPSGALIPE